MLTALLRNICWKRLAIAGLVSAFSISNGLAQANKKQHRYWEVGALGGLSIISGDIPANAGYGAGVSVKKSFTKHFAARLDYTQSINYGLDYRRRLTSRMAWDSPFDPWINYYENGNHHFVANYRTALQQLSLQAMLSGSLGRVFGKAGVKNVYLYAGYSLMNADIRVDALDENMQPYNFSPPPSFIDFKQSRKEVVAALKRYMNFDYESTWGQTNGFGATHNGWKDAHPVRHGVSVGTGFNYAVKPSIILQADYKITTAFTDYLDGVTTGNKHDLHHFASLGIHYRFGKNKGLKKHTDIIGKTTMKSKAGNLATVIHVVDPNITGKVSIVEGDTAYLFTFDFLPIVPGKVTPLHSAYLRLKKGGWLQLPLHESSGNMLTTKRFYYSVSITREQLIKLANDKVTHIALETSSLQLDDMVQPRKQKLLSKIAASLLQQ